MKLFLLLSLALIFVACGSGNRDETATKPDSTLSATSDSHGAEAVDPWNIDSFVDDFGESGKEKYVKTSTEGTFSNSATSDSYLMVKLLLTRKNAALFLHEYRDNSPAQKFIGTGKIRLKAGDGPDLTVYSFSEWNQQGGLLIDNENFTKLKNYMLGNKGKMKTVVYDEYSSVYNFTIDLDTFEKKYLELKIAPTKK